jgi:hypothetical protein
MSLPPSWRNEVHRMRAHAHAFLDDAPVPGEDPAARRQALAVLKLADWYEGARDWHDEYVRLTVEEMQRLSGGFGVMAGVDGKPGEVEKLKRRLAREQARKRAAQDERDAALQLVAELWEELGRDQYYIDDGVRKRVLAAAGGLIRNDVFGFLPPKASA